MKKGLNGGLFNMYGKSEYQASDMTSNGISTETSL